MKWLLASDLDGTLLNHDCTISEENLQAIKKFMDAGNYFTIATGRHITTCHLFIDDIPVNAPCIFLNGVVMQYPDGQIEKATYLNKKLLFPYVKACIDKFDVVEIYTTEKIHLLHPEKKDPFLEKYQVNYMRSTLEDVLDKDWTRFAVLDFNHGKEIEKFLKPVLSDEFKGFYSDHTYFEVTPSGVSKGSGVVELASQLNVHSAAIGDFYNDVEMVTMAEVGFAVDNAVDELKKIADKVVAHHEKFAIKEAIEYLMNLEHLA